MYKARRARLIGIAGAIGSGKDTLAQMICNTDPSFEIKKFAAKLKQLAALMTGVPGQYTQQEKEVYLPEWGMTVREFQQKLGTEAVRVGLHTDAWVLALFADFNIGHSLAACSCPSKHNKYCSESSSWIISDVRFENEAYAIRERGGLLIRLDGSRTPQIGSITAHPSETALDDYSHFDVRFDNSTASLEDLRRLAADIVRGESLHV